MSSVPVVSVVGRSNVGKTTLLERLIAELKRRGYRVATVKHDVHGFEMDRPGKDTWRHAQAGSDLVVIASPQRFAMIGRTARELTLDEIVARLPVAVDIVLTEGYKGGDRPKIEVARAACGRELLCRAEELLALVSDEPHPEVGVPQYGPEDAEGLVDLLERHLGLRHPFA
ncbi:MAG: molybdopterin-guanine dinucleotide biosynthesis protein B [Anaerolineae bacterium]|nr:molybdopterin-guanine dinucleotide biosynthesis protein B [Anaerolineae bacterium]